MKIISSNTLLLLFSILLLGSCSSLENSGSEKSQKEPLVLDMRDINFHARSLITGKGRRIDITSDYVVEINKDSASAYLPYYGRVYATAQTMGGGGIEFDGEMQDVKEGIDKKNRHSIEFRIKRSEGSGHEIYKVRLVASDEGYGTLYLTSSSRQSITYYGIVRPGAHSH